MDGFLKDYEFELKYHLGKANVVEDAWSRKSLSVAWMMIKEAELIESFRDLNLGISITPQALQLSQIKILRFQGMNSAGATAKYQLSAYINPGAIREVDWVCLG